MEKKFTPGPWVAVEADFTGCKHYGVSPLGDLGLGVALTGLVGDGDDDESQANANLIAAAPELFYACENVRADMVARLMGDDTTDCSSPEETIAYLDAAIKKAYVVKP